MRPALIALFVLIAVVLVVRSLSRGTREYPKFKALTTTTERQRVMRRWVLQSFAVFGGTAALVLFAMWGTLPDARDDALRWPPLRALVVDWANPIWDLAFAVAIVVLVAVTVIPVFALRRQLDAGDLPAVGDIGALLPRTRGELIYGVGLSINAGVIEELLFRLGMPALVFGILGNGVLSFVIASVLFGLLHLYQKVVGVLVATVLGLLFSFGYLITGSIWLVMAVHAFVDLRSLVLIPLVVGRVWRVAELPRHAETT